MKFLCPVLLNQGYCLSTEMLITSLIFVALDILHLVVVIIFRVALAIPLRSDELQRVIEAFAVSIRIILPSTNLYACPEDVGGVSLLVRSRNEGIRISMAARV